MICFHRHEITHQETYGEKEKGDERDFLPGEISCCNIVGKIDAKNDRKLDKQKGAQPDLVSTFFHLSAFGLEKGE